MTSNEIQPNGFWHAQGWCLSQDIFSLPSGVVSSVRMYSSADPAWRWYSGMKHAFLETQSTQENSVELTGSIPLKLKWKESRSQITEVFHGRILSKEREARTD